MWQSCDRRHRDRRRHLHEAGRDRRCAADSHRRVGNRSGVFEIAAAIRLHKGKIKNEWLLILSGVRPWRSGI
jgi:hypothetical protein